MELASARAQSVGRYATHDVMCDPAESGQETRRWLLFVRAVFARDFLCLIGTGQKKV